MYRKCNRCSASYWASLKSSCQCRNLKKTPKTSCPSLTGYGHHKRLNSAFISQIHNKRINFLINSSIYSIVSKIISDNSAASTIVIDTPSSPSTPNSPVSSTTLNGKFETFLLIFVDFYFSSISKTITLYIYIYKKKNLDDKIPHSVDYFSNNFCWGPWFDFLLELLILWWLPPFISLVTIRFSSSLFPNSLEFLMESINFTCYTKVWTYLI